MKTNKNIITKFPKVNFIGNKQNIAKWICSHFPNDANSIFDAFSGGGSVSYFSKKMGLKVISNDILKINYLIGKSLIENQVEILSKKDTDIIFSKKPIEGFMYKNYSNVCFFPEECMELDQYRNNIECLSSPYKKALALVLLRRSMIRKTPYSRFNISWDKIKQLRDEKYSYEKYKRKRAYHNKSFRFHFLDNILDYNSAVFNNNKKNLALNEDAFNVLGKIKTDIVYLDPPYSGTMNNYFGFYGIFDNFVNFKMNYHPFENNFIDKQKSLSLLENLFSMLSSYKYWYLSYNNNAYPSKKELLLILKKYTSNVRVVNKKHNYKITGKNKKNKNKEYLFIVNNN